MAKSWPQVVANPEFQKLSPADSESARNQYFDDVVAPNVPTDQLDVARAQFDSDTKPGATAQPSNGAPASQPSAPAGQDAGIIAAGLHGAAQSATFGLLDQAVVRGLGLADRLTGGNRAAQYKADAAATEPTLLPKAILLIALHKRARARTVVQQS